MVCYSSPFLAVCLCVERGAGEVGGMIYCSHEGEASRENFDVKSVIITETNNNNSNDNDNSNNNERTIIIRTMIVILMIMIIKIIMEAIIIIQPTLKTNCLV